MTDQIGSNIVATLITETKSAMAAGDVTKSELGLKEILRLTPDWLPGRIEYAGFLSELGRLEEAAEILRAGWVRAPDTIILHVNYGFTLFNLGRHAEAISSFKRAILLDPTNPESALGATRILAKTPAADTAIELFNWLAVLSPSDPRVLESAISFARPWARRSHAAWCKGFAFKSVLLQPDGPKNIVALVWCLVQLSIPDRLEKVSGWLRPIIRDDTTAFGSMAFAMFELERPDLAVGFARRSLALDPGPATIWFLFARTLRALNRDEEKRNAIRHSVVLDPSLAEKADLLNLTLSLCDFHTVFEKADIG